MSYGSSGSRGYTDSDTDSDSIEVVDSEEEYENYLIFDYSASESESEEYALPKKEEGLPPKEIHQEEDVQKVKVETTVCGVHPQELPTRRVEVQGQRSGFSNGHNVPWNSNQRVSTWNSGVRKSGQQGNH